MVVSWSRCWGSEEQVLLGASAARADTKIAPAGTTATTPTGLPLYEFPIVILFFFCVWTLARVLDMGRLARVLDMDPSGQSPGHGDVWLESWTCTSVQSPGHGTSGQRPGHGEV